MAGRLYRSYVRTTDCSWTDNERARWFSWFLSGSAKVTWQRTVKIENKTSWQKIVETFRGQYGIHMDPRTAYQRCHDLQCDGFGSVQGLLEAMRDYQRMAPQKLRCKPRISIVEQSPY